MYSQSNFSRLYKFTGSRRKFAILLNMITTLLSDEQLLDQFQQAMRLPVNEASETRLRGALHALMGELLCRNPQYDKIKGMRTQSMLLACRIRLRALQNTVLAGRGENDFAPLRCGLRAWFEDLCAAADMLLHPLGRAVLFEAPEESIEAACAPRDIAWLLLELICNCARHCESEEISVDMSVKRTVGRPSACVTTVACAGALDLRRLHEAGQRQGSGVSAIQRVAWLHGGSVLWLQREGHSVASFRMPLRPGAALALAETPDFVELLSDRLSLAYTALAPAAAPGF